jgi:catechol 2,3-dioxygenase-like lactoylglutathione lyase family enzyme
MVELKGISHVNLRVADQEVSKRFYRDLLGFVIAEEDPEHGGVFMTLGDNFHTVDIGARNRGNPSAGQIGRGHISFQVGSYAALRDAYAHLVGSGVEILRATVQLLFRRSRRQHARDLLRAAARAGRCSPKAGPTRTRS